MLMGKTGRPTDLDKALHVSGRLQVQFADSDLIRTVLVAGSVRRLCPTVSDVDILIELRNQDPNSMLEVLAGEFPDFHWTPSSGVADIDDVRVEIFRAPPGCAGATLQFLTGPGDYNVYLRARAKNMGMRLSQYGLWRGQERLDASSDSPVNDEYSIFQELGVKYLNPEERTNWRDYR